MDRIDPPHVVMFAALATIFVVDAGATYIWPAVPALTVLVLDCVIFSMFSVGFLIWLMISIWIRYHDQIISSTRELLGF